MILIKVNDNVVQDVCLSSTRVALEFYHAARDAILLYEAVVPVKVSPCKAVAYWLNFSISIVQHYFPRVKIYGEFCN